MFAVKQGCGEWRAISK